MPTAPAGASHVELRPSSDFDGTVVIESLKKIAWDYTVPTPTFKKYYSWDANTLVVQLACPTTYTEPASPTTTYSGGCPDRDFGLTTAAVEGDVANDYVAKDFMGGDADILFKVKAANNLFIQNGWQEHLAFPALAVSGQYAGGCLVVGQSTAPKTSPSDFTAVRNVFIADCIADHNEQSNKGTFSNDGVNTYSGYNRDMINLESVHPTYQAASVCDVINFLGKNSADAMIDSKRNTWAVNCEYQATGGVYRAFAIHGFNPLDVDGFRGQPTMHMVGCKTDDLTGTANSFSFFCSTAYCYEEFFNCWVGNRRVVDLAQLNARAWQKMGDGATATTANYDVKRRPLANQTVRNRIPFLKWGLQYRVTAGPGAWVDLDVGRSGPFPAGALAGTFDLSAVSGQQIDVRAWYATHGAKTYSANVTLTLGAGIGSEMITNGAFTTDLTGWTGTNWAQSAGKAVHTPGSTSQLRQAQAPVATTMYRLGMVTSGRTAGTVIRRLTGGTTVSFPTAADNRTWRGYRKAAPSNNNCDFVPNSAFDGSVDDVTLKKISLAGNA